MKKNAFLMMFIFLANLTFAGTGHSKDMDITYLLIITILGVVIYIWNIIDHISKNKKRIMSSARCRLKKIRSFIRRMTNDAMALNTAKDPLN